MNIPFLNLKKINEPYQKDFDIVVSSFFESGYYILGKQVKQFELEFANYCGVKNVLGVGNGYDALFLILKGYLELGALSKGDEIIVAANTYIATIIAVQNAGLKPVLVEPIDATFNLDPLKVEPAITSRTKGILVTHLYGQIADMVSFRTLCDDNNLLLLSDAAQAHGASDKKGRRAGNLADACGFSFYPTKNLGCLGDGGAIATHNDDLANVIGQLRNYGAVSKYKNNYIGVNSRLDEIQAAILRVKLRGLDNDNKKRVDIAKKYLSGIKNSLIELPYYSGLNDHVFHLFVIRCKHRDELQEYLDNKGVGTLIHYPIPVHKQKAFESAFGELIFKITEKQCNELLSIPISPIMTDTEVDYVMDVINSFQ